MNNRYVDLIDQTFYFPQEGFDIDSNGYLEFNGVPLKYLIEKYGTPFKVFYLPKIGEQIKKAKNLLPEQSKRRVTRGGITTVTVLKVIILVMS